VNTSNATPKAADLLDGATNVIYLKGNSSRSEMTSSLGTQSTIIDGKTNDVTILKDYGEQKYMIKMTPLNWKESNKKYEDIQEVIKKTNTIEDLKKSNEGKDQIIEELKVKISGAYSSDKIENLARVKDLKKEIEENKKQIEELKENAQPEIKLLKKPKLLIEKKRFISAMITAIYS